MSSVAGSSPLARGLPGALVCEDAVRWDHPRSRGVYAEYEGQVSVYWGSSPLARGLPVACVASALISVDHPRSRGVYVYGMEGRHGHVGSSPLARGLPLGGRLRTHHIGIIPARAGFTQPHPNSVPNERDHPRSRGVYLFVPFVISDDSGSSPLARGLLGAILPLPRFARIIPARAGFTLLRAYRSPLRRDHPRSRGVYTRTGRLTSISTWIIPARAGFTDPWAYVHRTIWDHPRSRGVYGDVVNNMSQSLGSSPLARGLQFRIP